jgi:aspartyl-tRNA(Asn)/glutamyl-tRNA(Gln) amidotransferase subunit C
MPLNLDDIRRVAHLARIEVTDADLQAAQRELNGILNLVEQLQAAETAGVEPMAHAQDVTLRLREDEITESDQRARFQSIAPRVDAGLYLVPKVIE